MKCVRRRNHRITTLHELKAFFRFVDAREKGRELDWGEHLAVVSRSRASGQVERSLSAALRRK